MSNLNFEKMQEIQKELQEHYKDKWEAIMSDPAIRKHFIEEMCDVLMYFNDVMLCYHVTPEELEKEYLEKHQRNLTRW